MFSIARFWCGECNHNGYTWDNKDNTAVMALLGSPGYNKVNKAVMTLSDSAGWVSGHVLSDQKATKKQKLTPKVVMELSDSPGWVSDHVQTDRRARRTAVLASNDKSKVASKVCSPCTKREVAVNVERQHNKVGILPCSKLASKNSTQ